MMSKYLSRAGFAIAIVAFLSLPTAPTRVLAAGGSQTADQRDPAPDSTTEPADDVTPPADQSDDESGDASESKAADKKSSIVCCTPVARTKSPDSGC